MHSIYAVGVASNVGPLFLHVLSAGQWETTVL